MAYDFDNAAVKMRSRADIVAEMMAGLQGLDVLAREMERKWGSCRLPALVSEDLAKRFYSQHRKTSMAVREGREEDAIVEINRMKTAWRYLDGEAERLGAEPINPNVIEETLSDGTVIAIVRDIDEALAVDPVGRKVRVYLASEIARLIEGYPTIAAIKDEFPGAKVKEVLITPPDTFWEHGDELPF
jgi:hypothetical protein